MQSVLKMMSFALGLSALWACVLTSVVEAAPLAKPAKAVQPLSPNEMLRQGMLQGKGALVREALLKGADPNFQLYDKFVLHWAVEFKQTSLIALLREKKVKLNRPDSDGLTPLMRMAQYPKISEPEHIALIRHLMDTGMDPSLTTSQGKTAIFWAAGSGNTHLVALLLEKGVSPNLGEQSDESPLMMAAHRGHLAVAQQLLSAGADLRFSQRGESALTYALIGQHPEMVSFLIQQGLPVTAAAHGGVSPLFSAIFALQPEGLRLVLAAGAELEASQEGETPLLRAAWAGFEEGVALLLKQGADVNARDSEGNTALHKALASGASGATLERLIQHLLAHHADPNLANQAGETPLALAQAYGYNALVDMLKAAGAIESTQEKGGQ